MSENKPEAPRGATSAELAQLYDCTIRQIELLAQKGIAVRVGRGRYNPSQTTRNYVRHLREQAASRVGRDPAVDGVAANVKWKETNTELIRLRLRKEAGELVAVDDVRDSWGRIMRGIRQFVLALPGKIAFEVPTLSIYDRGVIDRICRDGLEDASMERGFDASPGDDVSEDHVPDQPTDEGDAGAVEAAA